MKKYKLTTQGLEGYERFQHELGVRRVIKEPTDRLCSKGVFHFYNSPEEAVLFNPVHANIQKPKLFEVEIDRVVAEDGLIGGCHQMTLVKEIPLPSFTTEQKVKFAILCTLEVYKGKAFVTWANRWLSGADRSKESSNKATSSSNYTFLSVTCAACAAYSDHEPNTSAYTAYAADAAATYAAKTGKKINFKKIISKL